MIPDITETAAMIERDLPGWDWLIRTINPNSPRDTMRGQGRYYAHVFKIGEFDQRSFSFGVAGERPAVALFEAYCKAMSVYS